MKQYRSIAMVMASLILTSAAAAGPVTYHVTDNHPTGGPGATKEDAFISGNDPRVQLPGKCGHFFLGGFAFGHPDPRIKDPKAVCGHGILFQVTGPPDNGTPPLLITPVTAPVAPNLDISIAASRATAATG